MVDTTLNPSVRRKIAIMARVKSMIDHPKVMPEPMSGCWIWMGGLNRGGYGTVGYKDKTYLTHRHSWYLEHGPIPASRLVLHKCHNRTCCNPDHLYLGDHKDNFDDMMRAGRANVVRGEAHYRTELTEELVREIRRRYAASGRYRRVLKIAE